MAKAKDVPRTAKKSAPAKTAVRKAAVKKAAPRKAPRKVSAKAQSPEPAKLPEAVPPSIAEAQTDVLASKFVGPKPKARKAAPRPTLPVSYGESHLLLLVRDPQTLFAAWDMEPSAVNALKARLGSRAFAVSTLTLRLTRAGGSTSVFHVGRKARSRYVKVDGGPSFIAEIGFTPPSGRFELMARSAPCFVPMGPRAHQELRGPERRSVLGYRAARALARRGLTPSPPGGTGRRRSDQSQGVVAGSPSDPSASRVLGGASDLYRR